MRIFKEKKRYVTQPLSESHLQLLSSRKPGKEIERTMLASEEVSGYPTVKSRVRYEVQGKKMVIVEWFSQRLGVVLRSEVEDRSVTSLLSGIKEQALGRQLFEIPADYQALSARDVIRKAVRER